MFKMIASLVLVSTAAAVLWRWNSLGAGELAKHPILDTPAVQTAVRHLEAAKQASTLDAVSVQIARAVEALGKEHFAAQMLSTAVSELPSDIQRLKVDVGRVIESLTFRPWMEAELPQGFPNFTPVHHIELKTLPGYRMARAPMPVTQSSGERGAFWKLFNHINRNDIAMTAPVQMDYNGRDEDAEVRSMAFLYGSTTIGVPGNDRDDSSVTVVDTIEQCVVSIGVRGRMTPESVEDGHHALLQWLREHRGEYRPSGPLRRMGYNSPFISSDRAFFELHIPIQKTRGRSLEMI